MCSLGRFYTAFAHGSQVKYILLIHARLKARLKASIGAVDIDMEHTVNKTIVL